jgi:hypothetical protein
MTGMGIAIYYFFLLLALIIISTALGHGLRRLAWGRPLGFGYAQVLYSGLTGAVALATVGALWWTHGVTIHLLAVVVGLFMWHETRREKSQSALEVKPENMPGRWWGYWPLLAGAGLVYAFCAWGFVRPGAYVPFSIPDSQATVHHDHVNYARVAHFLTMSGDETDTFFLNLLDQAYQGAKPYHYLQLWLTNVMASVSGERQVVVLYLVVYPFFYWLALVGILALWQAGRHPAGAAAFAWSIPLLFVGGFTFGFYKSIGFLALLGTYQHAVMSGLAKLGPVYAFLLAAWLLYGQRQFLLALLALLGLGVASGVVFPALALATVGGSLLLWLARPQARPEAARAFIYALVFGLGVAVFYAMSDTSSVGREGASAKGVGGLVANLLDPATLRTRINILVGTQLQFGIVYAPFLLLPLLFWRSWWPKVGKPHLVVGLFVGLLLLSGTLAWIVFYKQLNSSQLFYNLAVPLANVLAFSLAVWIARQPLGWRSWVAGGIFASSAAALFLSSLASYPLKNTPLPYSDQYLQRVEAYLAQQPGDWLAGASLKGSGAYYDIFQKYVTLYTNGAYLAYLGNGEAMTVSLNDLEIPLASDPLVREREQQAISMGLFYRWVAREKAAGTFRDVPTSQLAFVRHYGLKFLIISKGVEVPATLKPLVVEEFADELSGDRFLVLNTPK